MKKLTVLAALLFAVSAGTTAFAGTEYDPQEKSVSNTNQVNYQTVLITEGNESTPITGDTIVYADQAAEGTNFQTATKFILKRNSEDGTSVKDGLYTIRFGSSNGQTTTAPFAVGVGIEGYDTKLNVEGDPVESNGKYSHGFVTPAGGVKLTNDAIILVKIGNDVMAYPVSNTVNLSGGVTAVFGVQIDDVPAETSVEVYLRQGATVE
ncbi:MAG: hypothetical protein PUD92_05750 [Clostridiales bacterium]|nr:hypothetical protein [Clostridiales bacterium]